MLINKKEFDVNSKTYVMGILNVTPDSFSDGGKYTSFEMAKRRVDEMIAEGVDIIDVGGESTRPNYEHITIDEEMERVIPVIEMINKEFDIPISVDTYHSRVAREAIFAGAGLVNDIWGGMYEEDMASVISEYNVPYCLMHNKKVTEYSDVVEDVVKELYVQTQKMIEKGVKPHNLIVDPGIGFAKTYEHNLALIQEIDKLSKLGYPILLGTSRKSVIGLTLNTDVTERVEGTLATTAYALTKTHIAFFRVHDIKENVRVIKMIEAIKNGVQ